MTRALTPASILAASLILVPLSASAGDNDSKLKIDYITIVDSSEVGQYLVEELKLEDYEGPVVVARTAPSHDLQDGYILSLSFSSEAMGPMEEHPIFELVDHQALEGAPIFLTDALNPKKLMIENDINIDVRDMAGFLDMNYAAADVYDELNDGVGEGDYLAVTHGKVSDELGGQQVFGADVFDPSWISSLTIAEESMVRFYGDKSLAIALNVHEEVAVGFEQAKLLWLVNGPDSADHSDDEESAADQGNEDGTAGSDDGSDDGSNSESIVLGDEGDSTSVGAASDLPQFTTVRKTPLRAGAKFAASPTLR